MDEGSIDSDGMSMYHVRVIILFSLHNRWYQGLKWNTFKPQGALNVQLTKSKARVKIDDKFGQHYQLLVFFLFFFPNKQECKSTKILKPLLWRQHPKHHCCFAEPTAAHNVLLLTREPHVDPVPLPSHSPRLQSNKTNKVKVDN